MNICSHASPPTADHECLAAVFSRGRDCRKCPRVDCYRQGWEHPAVTIDNARRVAEKSLRVVRAKRKRAAKQEASR